MLFIAKLVVTPALVWLTGWIMRRYGGIAAGMLAGFPVMTAPVAIFMTVEQGEDFGARSAVAILLALPGVSIFAIVYAVAARRLGWRWPPALGLSIIAYFAASITLVYLDATPLSAASIALGVVAAGLLIVRDPGVTAPLVPPPWWDVWLRMALTALLVLAITAAAGVLGPQLSAVPATFPAITSIITPFTHARGGAAPAERLLRGMLLSHISFAVLFGIVAASILSLGLAVSYAIALAAALVTSALVITASRRLSAEGRLMS